MPPRAARLQDVAAATRLSKATVSRHLNNTIDLPLSTRQRIDDAVLRLGYRANSHARSLSRGRSDQIGLVLPDLANPFFAQLAAAVEQAAAAAGFGLLLCTTSNRRERELDYLRRLGQNQIDGLIFVTNHGDDGSVADAINGAQGVVLLDEDVAGTVAPKIFADNVRGGWLAAMHLLGQGHRAIAIIGGPAGLMSAQERAAGVRQAVASVAGARITADYAGEYAREHGRSSATTLLSEQRDTTAVFTANDAILVGVLETFRDRGVDVPGQMSIITFDDAEPLHLFDPPVSAIRQDIQRMGHRALDALIHGQGGSEGRGSAERIPVRLIARASVAPSAG